ncbi:MAG: RagB/SusD family nutrient uptake outer membrane protein [Cyclobacteriaceae bacterium]|nr:MAG: RagB/SusD family nutrient uptake outer membrane protein [Cyclobacteriaceae bacterium]
MKANKFLLTYVITTSLLMTACLSDLDPKPLGPRVTTSENVYKTTDDFKSGLAKLYASFAVSGQQGPAGDSDIAGIDEGFGTYLRAYWNCQELTTDEAVISWNDQTIKDFHWHTWTPNDVFISAMYSRIMYTVAICNEFIRASSGNEDADVQTFNAEARFLRALAYFHALDMFGNPPFVTEADKPGSYFPAQIERADLFDYIESELIAIEEEMGNPKFEYARADKAALWMLQAKLYLNAEVYVNQTKYTEAITALNKIFASGAYSLSSNADPDLAYRHNFVADNHTSPEIIFPFTYDGQRTQTFGGMVYLIHGPISADMDPLGRFGVQNPWSGIRTTSAIVDLFDDISGDTDHRALFFTSGHSKEINDIGVFTDGYSTTKFRNRKLDGTLPANPHPDFVDTDYPMFRLADAYLMYAEAVLRGGSGGSLAQALDYINEIRERAYGDTSGNIDGSELTLEFILDERARELYWEGHRRTDLIRYGLFTGGDYLWPWKGNVKEGTATDAFRDLFPIPSADLVANPTLEQNTGY